MTGGGITAYKQAVGQTAEKMPEIRKLQITGIIVAILKV